MGMKNLSLIFGVLILLAFSLVVVDACTDYDGGLNYGTASYAENLLGFKFNDRCGVGGVLVEQTCEGIGDTRDVFGYRHDCSTSCYNGACKVGTVTGLSSTSQTDRSLTFDWDNTPYATSYAWEVKIGSTRVSSGTTTSSYKIVAPLSSDTSYTFYVNGVNSVSSGAVRSTTSTTTSAEIVDPEPPTGDCSDCQSRSSISCGQNVPEVEGCSDCGTGTYCPSGETCIGGNCVSDCVPQCSLSSANYCEGVRYTGNCGQSCVGTKYCPDLHWENTNGEEITGDMQVDLGDTVIAFLDSGPANFNIWEKDILFDNEILEDVEGEPDGRGNWIYAWVITEEDLAKADNYDNFYFKTDITGNEESNKISINPTRDDTPTDIVLTSPRCGEIVDKGEEFQITIAVSDDDSIINGNVSVDGVVIPDGVFSNGGFNLPYSFNEVGNHQIKVEAINNLGQKFKYTSNIMVVADNIYGKYVAACIDFPKNYDNIESSRVHFNASSTRGVEVNSSGIFPVNSDSINLEDRRRFTWYWRFFPEDTIFVYNSDDANDANVRGYDFSKEFMFAGGNSASLRVDFD